MDERMKREKARLRSMLGELLKSLPEDYLERSDRGIEANVLALPQWKQARTVFVYVSVGQEPDTRGLILSALADGKTVAVPRTLGGGVMEARVISSLDGLLPGPFGIPEPAASAPLLMPEAIDLVVVPCVAADRHGYRLGHGGGYYDRFLAQTICTSVCLCRGRLLKNELPHDALDRPIYIIISEDKVMSARS